MDKIIQGEVLQNKLKKFEAGNRNIKIAGMQVKLKSLLDKKVGVVLDGRIYPIVKGRQTSWSFLQSATTKTNVKFFKTVIEAVTKAKTKEEKEKAYIDALSEVGDIPSEVSAFILKVADTVKVDARANNGLNLYKRQNIRQYYAEGVTPPPPNEPLPKPAQPPKKEIPTMEKEKVEEMPKRKMRGQEKEEIVTDDPKAPIELRARQYDPSKYEGNPRMEMIKGKVIRKDLIQRGEFGYVFRGKIFPVWKADILASGSNSWSMVESRMTTQELELFRRMKTKSNDDALALYYDFMQEVQNIPIEVISRGLELANNKGTEQLVKILEDRMKKSGYTIEDGFNINFEPEGGKSVFQSIKGKFTLLLPVQKLKKARTRLGNAEFEEIQLSEEELKKLFDGIDIYDNVEIDKLKTKISEEEMSQNIRTERDLQEMEERERAKPSERDDEELEVFDVDAMGNIIEDRAKPADDLEALADATAALADPSEREEPEPMEQRIGYTPPISQNNNVPNIQMEISEGKDDAERRQKELDKAAADEETKAEELERDNIPDISRHGHQVAIQNVFIKEGKDFTFIKEQVRRNQFLNKPNKDIKAEVDLIYAYYSSLFPLTAPKEYSEENCVELKTLEFQYKRNIQFERKWKSSLANMQGGGGATAPTGQTMGAIINLENMGITAQQLFQQNQPQAPAQPAPQAPLNNPPPAPEPSPQKDSTGGNPIPKGTSAVPLTDINEKKIPQPQNIKPKSTRKREKRVKFQDVKLKVRQKQIKPNLLFTNPKIPETPPQVEGDLPVFRYRARNSNRRRF